MPCFLRAKTPYVSLQYFIYKDFVYKCFIDKYIGYNCLGDK